MINKYLNKQLIKLKNEILKKCKKCPAMPHCSAFCPYIESVFAVTDQLKKADK